MSNKIKFPDLSYRLGSGKLSVREYDIEVLLPHGSPVINKKTGGKYYYKRIVLNATNENDGQLMVLYKNDRNESFVREVSEFCEKFLADLSETEV